MDSIKDFITSGTADHDLTSASLGAERLAVLLVNNDGRILTANRHAEVLFQAGEGELCGRRFGYPLEEDSVRSILLPASHGQRISALMLCAAIERGGSNDCVVTLLPQNESGEDLRPERNAGRSELLRALVRHSPIAIIAVDLGGRVTLWNQAAARLLGWSDVEVIGQPLPSTSDDMGESLQAVFERTQAGEDLLGYELTGQHNHAGQLLDLQAWTVRMRGREGMPGGVLIMLIDITTRRRIEAHFRRIVGHDTLTGLPNRKQFRKQLQRTIDKWHHLPDHQIIILTLGLDRFKTINNSLGHTIGDALLQAVARRISGVLYETDLVARTGGDEFSVLLRHTHQMRDAARVCEKLLHCFAQAFSLGGQNLFLTASIGVALWPHDGKTADDLIRAADGALMRAKDQGGDSCQFFTPELDLHARTLMMLETGLRQAIERNELYLDFQPKWHLADVRPIGVEALLRWRHAERGPVAPGEFIPVAETSGLILPIGRRVLQMACLQLRAWDAEGLPPLTMAVNVSARQFHHGDLIEEVAQALRLSGIAAERLELELTESLFMRNAPQVIETLHGLKELGVRLAIDDFGTGYSGLSYLVDLPIDTLKIDQSFIRRIEESPRYLAIVAAIVELAQGMMLQVVAEGVETAGQLDLLRALGAHEVQGFLLARPMPPERIAELFNQRIAGMGNHDR